VEWRRTIAKLSSSLFPQEPPHAPNHLSRAESHERDFPFHSSHGSLLPSIFTVLFAATYALSLTVAAQQYNRKNFHSAAFIPIIILLPCGYYFTCLAVSESFCEAFFSFSDSQVFCQLPSLSPSCKISERWRQESPSSGECTAG
jgi:hypothetical protein